MRAIRVHNFGGPENLSYDEVPAPQPGAGEALVQIKATGVNFIDVYHRTGRYPGAPPLTLGVEAVGVVEAVGSEVTDVRAGDRVGYCLQQGAYAEYQTVPASKLVPIPSGLDDQSATAALVQGMTAHYLVFDSYRIQPGDTVLVHAAAGGAGGLLTQAAKIRGARVIATVSTEAKAQLARSAGADEVILYSQVDFETEVKRLTDGKGVACVYDSVGKTTFDKSLNCLRPLGTLVLYGAASGPVPPFDPITLMNKGSLFLTRPTLGHYVLDRAALLKRANDVFSWIADGKFKTHVHRTYPLADAAQAHRDLESRATTGKLLLLPGS
ncbi:MAG TPA: quinone oxidoreductase [Anaerolineales bacterium]|nr:quinone oxidoreductase [Anaerolineales bacterium]